MFCKNCGKDINNSKFCPHCGTQAGALDDRKIVTAIAIDDDVADAIPVNDDEEPVSQAVIKTATDKENLGSYASTAYTEQKSAVFEKYKSTSKIFNLTFIVIHCIVLAIATCIAVLIAFTMIDYSKLPKDDEFRAIIEAMAYFIPLFVPIFAASALVVSVRPLIDALIWRSRVINNRLSPSELLPYTLKDGQYVINRGNRYNINAWQGLSFIEHPQATKYIFANLIVSISGSAVELFFSLVYSVELLYRLEILSELLNEEFLEFFVTPSLILMFLSAIVAAIVTTILNSKIKKFYEEIKTKYSK